MSHALPLVVVFGDRQLDFLARALDHIARVSHAPADLDVGAEVVVHVVNQVSDPSPLGEILANRSAVPAAVLAYRDRPMREEDARLWLNAGATAVTDRATIVDAVLRQLPGGARPSSGTFVRRLVDGPVPASLRDAFTLPEVEPEPLPEPGDPDLPPDLVEPFASLPAPTLGLPAVPPVEQVIPARDTAAAGYLRSLGEYYVIRRTLLARLGASSGRILNSLTFHRARTLEHLTGPILPDTFGMWRRDPRTPLGWPARLALPAPSSSTTILNASADGMCLRMKVPPPDDKHMVLQVEVEGVLRAELSVETRWQRRAGREAWEVGVVILNARTENLSL